MIWIAYCKKCGEIDKAPNGNWIEAVAKHHARKSGHSVLVGYDPVTEECKKSGSQTAEIVLELPQIEQA